MNCCSESNPIIAKTVRVNHAFARRIRATSGDDPFQILKVACSGGHINHRGAMYKAISHVAIDTGQDQIEALVLTSDGEKGSVRSPSSPTRLLQQRAQMPYK